MNLKNDIEKKDERILFDLGIIHHRGTVCHPKLKSLSISKIKRDRRDENYVEKNIDGFLMKKPDWQQDKMVYPYLWDVDK